MTINIEIHIVDEWDEFLNHPNMPPDDYQGWWGKITAITRNSIRTFYSVLALRQDRNFPPMVKKTDRPLPDVRYLEI